MTEKPKRKYNYPDDLEEWRTFLEREADDIVSKKLWRYLPRAKTKDESKVIAMLTEEMVSRGLL